ncbi:MAG: hypothetical protein ACMUHX_04100 [bacterium]
MGHEIAEAIIEDGQLKYISKQLPKGRIKVHVIYDVAEGIKDTKDILQIVKESAGLYRDIDPESESRELRRSWDRDVQ